MKLLLLCLGLTLVCAHHEENHDIVKCNFDMSKISGDWYTILLGSNKKETIEENGNMRMFAKYAKKLDNSSLILKYYKKINGECTELTFVSDETEEKGVYSVSYKKRIMFYIIEADYDEYAISYNMIFNYGKKTEVIELLARDKDVRPGLKERFEIICQNRGILKENILDLSKAGATPSRALEQMTSRLKGRINHMPHRVTVWMSCC